MRAITLIVNTRAVDAKVEPRTHLADFLRDNLNLTGTHLGCEHGVCGACTLLLDDMPARSCITYAVACDGARCEAGCDLAGYLVGGCDVAVHRQPQVSVQKAG